MEFKEIIKKHLDTMASEDINFAARYALKTKSLDKCIKYIFQEAKKQAQNDCSAIEDDIVFGWAAHYYQEDDVEPKESPFMKSTAMQSDIKPIKAVVSKQKKEYKELNLFDGF